MSTNFRIGSKYYPNKSSLLICFSLFGMFRNIFRIILLPSQLRGTIILAELPNSLAIALLSDTCRVERLFNFVPLLPLFILYLYNHPLLYSFRQIVPVRSN